MTRRHATEIMWKFPSVERSQQHKARSSYPWEILGRVCNLSNNCAMLLHTMGWNILLRHVQTFIPMWFQDFFLEKGANHFASMLSNSGILVRNNNGFFWHFAWTILVGIGFITDSFRNLGWLDFHDCMGSPLWFLAEIYGWFLKNLLKNPKPHEIIKIRLIPDLWNSLYLPNSAMQSFKKIYCSF